MAQTRYQAAVTSALQKSPHHLEQLARTRFGMTAAELDKSLQIFACLRKGEMPQGELKQHIHRMGRELLGMRADSVDAELRHIISLPVEQRVSAYLSANGRTPVDASVVELAHRFTGEYEKAQTEYEVHDRLDARDAERAKDPRSFGQIKADPRVAAYSKDQSDLRKSLEANFAAATGRPIGEGSLAEQQQRVLAARRVLADRIDMRESRRQVDGAEPTLRDTLRENYDFVALDNASRDVGLDSPRESFAADEEAIRHVEDGDVLEDLR